MPVACLLAPLCFALATGALSNTCERRELAVGLPYVIVLAALRAGERTWGLACHLARCRPTTAVVVGSVVLVQAGLLHAAASSGTVFFILPDRWLWFARAGVRQNTQKVKKRPTLHGRGEMGKARKGRQLCPDCLENGCERLSRSAAWCHGFCQLHARQRG
jgi:hypothetical protein